MRDAHIDHLSKRITCSTYRLYCDQDGGLLAKLGIKGENFCIDSSWHIQHLPDGAVIKAVGYVFETASALKEFVHRRYEYALVSDANSSFRVLLRDVTLNVDELSIYFEHVEPVFDGLVSQLKHCSKYYVPVLNLRRYLLVKPGNSRSVYKFNFTPRYCRLYRLRANKYEALTKFIANRRGA